MTTAEVAAHLHAPGCLVLERATSTLDVLHELAEQGAPARTLVIADEQVAGRGRQGRPWHSPPGAGIALAFLVRPDRAFHGGVLALRVGMAVADALLDLGVSVSLKWPNDVVGRDRKLCGVLCESRWAGDSVTWVAIGVGMNVHLPLPIDIAAKAIALEEINPDITRLAVLGALTPRLQRLDMGPALSEAECLRYAELDWLGHRHIAAPVAGLIKGIDADGALLVSTEFGTKRIIGGCVVLA